ncbi:MAG: 30S ribosomal protein THX [Rhodanobacter sp.]
MGKGDRKTRRGKTYRGSYGNTRAHAAVPAVAGGKSTVTKRSATKTTATKSTSARPAAAKKTAVKKKSA